MKRLTLLISMILLSVIATAAQTSSFAYQGKLADGGFAATGQYDFKFTIFGSDIGGVPVSGDILVENVVVTAGVFTVNLDFGTAPFDSPTDNHLEISVRPGASVGAYTLLIPRQRITSSPYSIKTLKASSADSLSNACVLCITDGHIVAVDGSKVTGTVTNALVPAGNINGVLSASQGGTGIGPAFPLPNTYLRSNGTGWTASELLTSDIPTNITVQAGNISGVLSALQGGTGIGPANPPDGTYLRSNGAGWTASNLSGDGSALTNLNGANITGVLSASQGGTGIGPAFPLPNTYLRSNGTGWTASELLASDITGVVPVAKGGTGSATQNFADLITDQNIGGNKTFTGTISGNGSGLTNLSGGNITPGSITFDKLGTGSVTANAIRDDHVTTDKIADGAVTTNKILGEAVTTDKLADGSVKATKLGALSVTSTALGDGSVLTNKIADGSVTTAKLNDVSVTTAKIADGSVTQSKLAAGFLPITYVTATFPVGINSSILGIVTCPVSHPRVVGGGFNGTGALYFFESRPTDTANGWRFAVFNQGQTPGSLTGYAICMGP